MNLSNSNTKVLKIKSLNKDNMQNFKRKHIKKWKYLSKEIDREEGNKKKILELITELFKDLIDDCTKNAKKLDKILTNTIRDWNKIEKLHIKIEFQ